VQQRVFDVIQSLKAENVAIVYITINFIVDVLYGVIDPRLRAS